MLPLACNMKMDLPEDVIWTFLLVFFLIPAGIAVVGLLGMGITFANANTKSMLENYAYKSEFSGKPLRLFFLSLALPGSMYAVCSFAIARLWTNCTGLEKFLVWMCALVSCGMIGALVYLWIKEPAAQKAADKAQISKPALVWLQDLVVTVLCFGAGLTVLWFAQTLHHFDSRIFMQWALYLFLVGASGLGMALHLGYTTGLGQMAAPRAVMFIVIYTLMPLLFPALWLAWWRWWKFNAANPALVVELKRE